MTLPAVSPVILHFHGRPGNTGKMVRSLLAARPAQAPAERCTTAFEAHWHGTVADAAQVRRYREVCGLTDQGTLPPLFLHAMAMPLHMAILAHPKFPLRLMGLVHLSNRMECLRPVGDFEVLDMDCRMDGIASDERGQTFTLHTRLHNAGELVWSESSTFLAPSAHRPKRAPVAPTQDWGQPLARWKVDARAGRRFASPSGDWNPIHLSALTARLFGYPRAIAHGMFSAARCVDLLGRDRPACEPSQIALRFKRPLLIPGEVALHALHDAAGTRFVLRVLPHGEPHIEGDISPLAA